MSQIQTSRKDVYRRRARRLAYAFSGVAILYVIGCGIGFFIKARTVSAKSSCIANLKQLDGAKASWALENHITNDHAIPKDSDLFGMTAYIREKPICPNGGVYTIGSVGEPARCSILMDSYHVGNVYVRDESDNPLVGVSVSVNGTNAIDTKVDTNTNGFASVNCWAGGATIVSISKPGYDTQRVSLTNYWPLKITLQRSSLQSKL